MTLMQGRTRIHPSPLNWPTSCALCKLLGRILKRVCTEGWKKLLSPMDTQTPQGGNEKTEHRSVSREIELNRICPLCPRICRIDQAFLSISMLREKQEHPMGPCLVTWYRLRLRFSGGGTSTRVFKRIEYRLNKHDSGSGLFENASRVLSNMPPP